MCHRKKARSHSCDWLKSGYKTNREHQVPTVTSIKLNLCFVPQFLHMPKNHSKLPEVKKGHLVIPSPSHITPSRPPDLSKLDLKSYLLSFPWWPQLEAFIHATLCAKGFSYIILIQFSPKPYEVATITIPILKMGKPKLRDEGTCPRFN